MFVSPHFLSDSCIWRTVRQIRVSEELFVRFLYLTNCLSDSRIWQTVCQNRVSDKLFVRFVYLTNCLSDSCIGRTICQILVFDKPFVRFVCQTNYLSESCIWRTICRILPFIIITKRLKFSLHEDSSYSILFLLWWDNTFCFGFPLYFGLVLDNIFFFGLSSNSLSLSSCVSTFTLLSVGFVNHLFLLFWTEAMPSPFSSLSF